MKICKKIALGIIRISLITYLLYHSINQFIFTVSFYVKIFEIVLSLKD